MADATEDKIQASGENDEDEDASDEVQDFRLLAHLTINGSSQSGIPKRGEKDFEPNPTEHQATLLDSSREAMHNALSYPRTHNPKSHIVGVWHSDLRLCSVDKPSGPHFLKLGTYRQGKMWLLPEEMLYLLERGNLDVRWGDELSGARGLPMSLQAGYSVVLGDEPMRMSRECWTVWSGLRRSGYVVVRCPNTTQSGDVPHEEVKKPSPKSQSSFASILRTIFGLGLPKEREPLGPLVAPGLYRNYDDVYRRLHLIQAFSPDSTNRPSSLQAQTAPPYQVFFNVYKPAPGFRKSAPGPPDFRVAVIDARTSSTPTLTEISSLLESTPFAPPPALMEKQNIQKLRHGYRNVVLAIVDQGVVSYLRLSDASFGEVKMYERKGGPMRGNKNSRGRGKKQGRNRR